MQEQEPKTTGFVEEFLPVREETRRSEHPLLTEIERNGKTPLELEPSPRNSPPQEGDFRMPKAILSVSLLGILAAFAVLVGCTQKPSDEQPSAASGAAPDQPAAMDHEGMAHEGMDHEGHNHGQSAQAGHGKYETALAELSPADRTLAEKQETCPVSGEPLGAMGKPYKVTIEGREVFLCCPGCEAKLKENPQEYLAKLSQ